MDKKPKKNRSNDALRIGLTAGVMFLIPWLLHKFGVSVNGTSGGFGGDIIVFFFMYICLLPIAIISTLMGLLFKLFDKHV
jgi:hypothetical protein